jgi:hypothetical protein
MAIDPLLDAMYVLRCFYGASLATGEDLSAAFRQAAAVVALLVLSFIVAAPALRAQATPADVQQPAIATQDLDRAIEETIHKREFTWRAPREQNEPPASKAGSKASSTALAAAFNGCSTDSTAGCDNRSSRSRAARAARRAR